MSETIEVKVPDIGDYKDVPVIEVFVKPGDEVKAEESLITVESDNAFNLARMRAGRPARACAASRSINARSRSNRSAGATRRCGSRTCGAWLDPVSSLNNACRSAVISEFAA